MTDDDLFRPTIETAAPNQTAPPWTPDSIMYPAFFGGPLAGAVLGALNARRLGLKATAVVLIAAAGLAAFLARILITMQLDANTGSRFVGAACGLAVWGVVIATQRRPFRRYTVTGREPDSLVAPGLAAAIGCGLFEAILIYGVIH
jgi:hypothetical protein